MQKRYIHTKDAHNLKDPKEIVTEILQYFSPKKVIDLWCWLWNFVKVFQNHGIYAVWVDGDWVNRSDMFIKEDSFIVKNLEEYMDRQKEFDLAISLEVAEHLSQESAENFVKTLISCADYIIFSAAIPQQRWQNHINEQPPTYREKIFNKYDYEFHDVFRHIFWNNNKIFWRYKQNIFLVIKKWCKIPKDLVEKPPRYIIHPECYEGKMKFVKNPYKAIRHMIYLLYCRIKKWF